MTEVPDNANLAAEESLDLTPDPRILEVIAEVDLQVGQCLAELIDNAFDELSKARAEDANAEHRVEITMPNNRDAARLQKSATIVVADTGRGMSRDQLRDALRAGSSHNARFGSLGLFGMGFNIATARMGHRTVVRSGRAGDTHWSVATIDIRDMKRARSYSVPLKYTPKAPTEHGTVITVSDLREDMVTRLSSPSEVKRVTKFLSTTYSYLLRNMDHSSISGAEFMGGMGHSLTLNGSPVKPYIHCIWDPSRSKEYQGDTVEAVQRVHKELSEAYACMRCGHWMVMYEETDGCAECNSTDVEKRTRVIHGWVGLQRYNHESDFGISLLRQGRVICHKDQGLFTWDDGEGSRIKEYPVELNTGRVVGEIHLDFVPVNYRKSDFDRESKGFRQMVNFVRGEGPILPKSASSRGYPENRSALGRLINAFRRNDPGVKSLQPGNGSTATLSLARDWAKEFEKGTPGYLDDSKWYEAAVAHDEIKSGAVAPKSDPDEKNDDALRNAGLDHLLPGTRADAAPGVDSPSDSQPPAEESAEARFARYQRHSRGIPGVPDTVALDRRSAFNIEAYLTSDVELQSEGRPAHHAVRVRSGHCEVYISDRHPLLVDFGWPMIDVVAIHTAETLHRLADVDTPVVDALITVLESSPDHKVDYQAAQRRADSIIETLLEKVIPIAKASPTDAWVALSPAAKVNAAEAAAMKQPDINWPETVNAGLFAAHLDVRGLIDLVDEMPEKMLDGHVFTTTYSSWEHADARRNQVDRLTGLLSDVHRMTEANRFTDSRELVRLNIGAEMLERVIADD
ncbi:ATP-binding protein [Demequina lutea]|uniref:Transcription elongation factor Elf1 n=1 Tax=Demequina lutea TaxID=431489 RepID=A0A7Y9Z8R1_9MICO|nr:ATP-binding protein [Demequina lutea]NYI40864.1 transcription elongation factor Elf1 [Demequina lutea]